jgi:cytochrome P450
MPEGARALPALDEELVRPATSQHPYDVYRRLRDEQPVFWSGQLDCWVISRYGDARAVLDDIDSFSSAGRVRRDRVAPALWRAFAGFDGFFWSDPPAYDAFRELWTRSFKPRLKGLPGVVERVVDELLADVDPGGDVFDAVDVLAFPLPATMILELLGIPSAERDTFRKVAADLIEGGMPAAESMDASATWLQELLEDRQRHPGDDILSDLVAGRAPVGSLDPIRLRSEIVDIVHFLLAGHGTTTSTIAAGLFELVRRADDRQRFLNEKALRVRAVEELLRFESPLQFIERRAARPVAIGGVGIEAESSVRILLGSANHDERVFDRPDELVLDRTPNPHLAFGQGIHVCLGAPLARIEIPIALERTLRRFPQLELAVAPDEISWRTDFMFHAIEHLPLAP